MIILYLTYGNPEDRAVQLHRGMRVEVTTATGDRVEMITVSGCVQGRDMPVVWVSEVDEYEERHDDAHRIPWPAQYVHALVADA